MKVKRTPAFSPFSTMFLKGSLLRSLFNPLLLLTHQQQTAFENIVGKGEIAHDEQFLLFPQCFLLDEIIVTPFVHIFDIISLFADEFEKPEIGL